MLLHQALEWVVRDVRRLQQFVEVPSPNPITTTSVDGTDKESFEILRDGPILGDQKFKLEIGMFSIRYTRKPSDSPSL